LVPNSALRYRPAPERVDPEHVTEYLEQKQRKAIVSELKPGKAADATGTVWVEEDDGYLRPVHLRLGLTDGNVTEVREVIDDELGPGDALVTGEVQSHGKKGNNPFAITMFSGKKKG